MLKILSIVTLLTVVSCSDDAADPEPPPEFSAYYLQVLENGTATINASALDTAGQNPAPSYSHTQPLHGAVTLSGTVFTYTPYVNYEGTDQFDIVRTANGVEATLPVVITVIRGMPRGASPVAQDLQVVFPEDVSVSTELLALDSDSTVLTYRVVTPPAHGTLIGTPPALVYAPNRGFVGTDQFTFKANDGESDSQLGVVTLTITAQ